MAAAGSAARALLGASAAPCRAAWLAALPIVGVQILIVHDTRKLPDSIAGSHAARCKPEGVLEVRVWGPPTAAGVQRPQ